MKPYGVEEARRDLDWLAFVRGVKSWSERGDGAEPRFVAVTATGATLTLSAADVRVLRAGVLAGYRLPRAGEVLS